MLKNTNYMPKKVKSIYSKKITYIRMIRKHIKKLLIIIIKEISWNLFWHLKVICKIIILINKHGEYWEEYYKKMIKINRLLVVYSMH